MTQADFHATPLANADAVPRPAVKPRRLRLRRIAYVLLLAATLAGVAALGGSVAPAQDPLDQRLDRLTAGLRFDLVQWEVDALIGKVGDLLNSPDAGLSPSEADALVRSYITAAQRAGQLEGDIERIFSDPQIADPEAATAGQRAELATIRRQLDQQASAAEAILQGQLSQIIRQEGLDTAGAVWPPPQMRFTEPPQMLVVSPRDRIQRLRSIDLLADLDTSGRERLESAVSHEDNLSAYVTGIGGYGVFPTMVVDRYGLPWTAETIAHEWVHTYLAFRPLGWSFLEGGDAVTMNETVASIIGEELGQKLLQAYYPDLAPPPPQPANQADAPPAAEDEFDFGREMHATRVAVDDLLAAGYVDEAEAFMEARRQTFLDNGYRLRVLNQAYFAFHGSYATGPAATDPIGPKLERLRELSPSLSDFMRVASGLTSVTELDKTLTQLEELARPEGALP
ncbi:MAG: hypothetical protein R2844_19020 [Caldilineales bacterium]